MVEVVKASQSFVKFGYFTSIHAESPDSCRSDSILVWGPLQDPPTQSSFWCSDRLIWAWAGQVTGSSGAQVLWVCGCPRSAVCACSRSQWTPPITQTNTSNTLPKGFLLKKKNVKRTKLKGEHICILASPAISWHFFVFALVTHLVRILKTHMSVRTQNITTSCCMHAYIHTSIQSNTPRFDITGVETPLVRTCK